jgi:hypothetical protein
MNNSKIIITPNIDNYQLHRVLSKMLARKILKSGLKRETIATQLSVTLSCIDKIAQGKSQVRFTRLVQLLYAMNTDPIVFVKEYIQELEKTPSSIS